MVHDRFHGRIQSGGRECEAPDCEEAGEFRAPGNRPAGFDGPGEWRYFCLEHVRAFNAGYDFFEGMNAEEILDAQHPVAGWARQTRAFKPDAGIDGVPRWADFDDPLDAIGARAANIRSRAAGRASAMRQQTRFTPHEQEALSVMGLGNDADMPTLRRRYTALLRRYHPDRNGGDRSQEGKLQTVIEAYQRLRSSSAFD